MRMRWAVVLAVLTFAPTAGAGTYAIDFSALAADAGSVVTTTFDTDEFRVYVNDVRVIGPDDPAYAGKIGIVATEDQFDVVIDPLVPRLREPFPLGSASATFAPYTGTAYSWHGVADLDERGPMWSWAGNAPGTATFIPDSPVSIDRLWLTQIAGTEAQMTGITIVADFATAPEPTGLVLLATGVVLTFARRRLSGRGRGTSGGGGKPSPGAWPWRQCPRSHRR